MRGNTKKDTEKKKEGQNYDLRNSKKQNCEKWGYPNGLGSPTDGRSERLLKKEVNWNDLYPYREVYEQEIRKEV